jgi:hypothetical protein
MPENMPVDTAAVSWLDNGGQVHLRAYSSNGDTVTEWCWDANGPWYKGAYTV